MTLTITIANDTDGQRLVDALCSATNYNAGSGMTKGAWVKDQLIKFIRLHAKRGEVKATAVTSGAEIDAIVIT